jgi:hypothetical protein
MTDWKVKVRTQSGYIKEVKVDDCQFREDAEIQALSSTGAKEVITSYPEYNSGYNRSVSSFEQNYSNQKEVVEVHHYHEPEEDDSDFYESLDEMEIEMYDLMCQIAMEKGKKLPTISEFYEWLESQ